MDVQHTYLYIFTQYTYICMHAKIHIGIHTHICTHRHTHIHTHIYIYILMIRKGIKRWNLANNIHKYLLICQALSTKWSSFQMLMICILNNRHRLCKFYNNQFVMISKSFPSNLSQTVYIFVSILIISLSVNWYVHI